MATYQDGGVRRATPNSVTAAKRSAKSRQCPKCNRKSALVFYSDDLMFGHGCRWADCGYERMTMRDLDVPTPDQRRNP
jgi:Zn ribbon nucleic-acid-binding protein